jgi:ribosomal protein S20
VKGHRLAGLAAVALAAALLAGCAQKTDLDSGAASTLQASVRAVAGLAASNDYSAAIDALDALQVELDKDLSSGLVGADRGARIQAAIDLVRADLAIRSSPTPTPTPTPGPTKGHDKGGDKGDKGNDGQ